GCVVLISAKPLDERRRLVGSEASDAAGLGDPDLFHDRPGLNLTDPGERLEQRDDLELAHDVVLPALLDDLLEGALRVLELVLDLGPRATRLCGLLECCRTLLGCEGR